MVHGAEGSHSKSKNPDVILKSVRQDIFGADGSLFFKMRHHDADMQLCHCLIRDLTSYKIAHPCKCFRLSLAFSLFFGTITTNKC